MALPPYHVDEDNVKAELSDVGDIGSLSADRILIKYLLPAERILDEEFRLDMDSGGFPARWAPRFDNATDGEAQRSKFLQDWKVAIYALIERLALNPHELKEERTGRVTAKYGPRIPSICATMLRRWGQPGRVFRA